MLIHHLHVVFRILHRPISKQLLSDFNFYFVQLYKFYESQTELRVQQDASMTENMKNQKD